MRKAFLALIALVCCSALISQQPMNNEAIIRLAKAGLSDDLILATITSQAGNYDTTTDGLITLKAAGVSDKVVAAILQKASAPTVQMPKPAAAVDSLTSAYKQNRNSVVTVLAEYGPAKGTGFIVDKAGLVVTNQHVVKSSKWVAVQIDDKTRLQAKVLVTDSEKDAAILWVNPANIAPLTPVVLLSKGDTPAEEGERVFTIGSPLHQSKILTTGIVSKVEDRVIISDININHGNSGGPLFNSQGTVIGITTFGDMPDHGGPGIAGIIRIEQVLPLIEKAKGLLATSEKPSPALLQLEPADRFPIDALKERAAEKKFKLSSYIFSVGDYDLAVITPVLTYSKLSIRVEAGREKDKRNQNSATAAQGTFEPLDDLKGWEEYIGDYEPMLLIQASPMLEEGAWSAFSRVMAPNGTRPRPANMHFKTDFSRMALYCGDQEILPIWPGKAEHVLAVNDQYLHVTDATFDGLYEFPYDAIRPDCGKVTLQIFSEQKPMYPQVVQLDKKTIGTVYQDFAPYRAQVGAK